MEKIYVLDDETHEFRALEDVKDVKNSRMKAFLTLNMEGLDVTVKLPKRMKNKSADQTCREEGCDCIIYLEKPNNLLHVEYSDDEGTVITAHPIIESKIALKE